MKQIITRLKFHSDLTCVPLLSKSFIRGMKRDPAKLPECIIPVPLHKQRLTERGFNQAQELAQQVATHFKIPLEHSLCQRKKATPYQSGLSAKERKQNLKNAFSITREHSYKHVAIFDDVVTTGTTVNELAKQLKRSGVEIIEVWAIARTSAKN
jgi:ComF family protein